jgi:hypothetical protein
MRTLRVIAVVSILLLASYFVVRLAKKNWFWYALLSLLISSTTFVAWLASQTFPLTLFAILAEVAITRRR